MINETTWQTKIFAPTPDGVAVWNWQQRQAYKKTRKFWGNGKNKVWNYTKVPDGSGLYFPSLARIGNMMEIVQRAQAKTEAEFIAYYLRNHHGWDEVVLWGRQWYQVCIEQGFKDTTPEAALAEVIIHVFDETWHGYIREQESSAWLAEVSGREVVTPDSVWDFDCAIDLIAVDESEPDGFRIGYQVKPASFFEATGEGVTKARQFNAKKHQGAEAMGKEVWLVDGDAVLRGEGRLIHWSELKGVTEMLQKAA